MSDPCSLSNLDEVKQTNLHLEFRADFEHHQIHATVTIDFEVIKENLETVILDSRELSIAKIEFIQNAESKELTDFSIGKIGELGEGITINLGKKLQEKSKFQLKINYKTSESSIGIQWLDEEQTLGKKHKYLFTQFQAIHCRTAIPCQDSPARKVPYSAVFDVPEALTVVMSAVSTNEPTSVSEYSTPHRRFYFQQKVPIPSYLIAFAVGNLVSSKIGENSRIWSEPEIIEKASFEFSDTDSYLKTAIELFGNYEWGIYDLLCLPPSFPYGGMENPCLTFITPTLLAGDRSLTCVVAHEIAHSWTGNLVTNVNWEHFWLNEGFTEFAERKIIGRLFGESERHLNHISGYKDLLSAVESYGSEHEYTKLVPKLAGVNPDDAFSSIPYEKGSQFLFYLEQTVGSIPKFEEFLRKWIETYKFQSVSTDDFVNFFKLHFEEHFNKIDWETWIHSPGLPPVNLLSSFDDSLAVQAKTLASSWINSENPDPNAELFNHLSPSQKALFLDQILLQSPTGLPLEKTKLLREIYKLDETLNSEIRLSWLLLCLKSKDELSFDNVVNFITGQGRMKFVRPLYKALATSGERGKNLALETFNKHKTFYHNITKNMLTDDLAKFY